MSVGSLKQVDLVKSVENLNDVPYLNFGQEIQSQKNLIRYYQIICQLLEVKDDLARGRNVPLPNSSYVNILTDDIEDDFFRCRFITYPKSGEKVNRFGHDLDQVKLDIEAMFVPIIKRIRADLGIEGARGTVNSARLGIGADAVIQLDPRQPSTFINSCIPVLQCAARLRFKQIGNDLVWSYDIDLPYFK